MKEIMAIIRRDKVPDTKNALAEVGYNSMTLQSVDGRGKQKGVSFPDTDLDMPDGIATAVKLMPTPSTYALEHNLPKRALYIPKKMMTIVVPDADVKKVVEIIADVSKTGKAGDGKIFVMPIEIAQRIRTGETDDIAVT